MLQGVQDQLNEKNSESVTKAIIWIKYALNNTIPEPIEESSLEKTIATFIQSFNDVSVRLGRVEDLLACRYVLGTVT